MLRPPELAATFHVTDRDKEHPESQVQLALEPELAPYMPHDIDATFGDEALARRVKAMACTVPLHQLEANKGRVRR